LISVVRKQTILALLLFIVGGRNGLAGAVREVRVSSPSGAIGPVSFFYRMPESQETRKPQEALGLLLLVPGFNGDGRMFLNEGAWIRFSDEKGMILVSPSFHTTPEEARAGTGYYYPKLGSGLTTLAALDQIAGKEHVKFDKILIFGFSAGAHFAHGFALWKPERVKAFVAYSAGWWDEPTAALHNVAALVMCGEGDERYDATRAFMARAQELHLPFVWRSYQGAGHVITPDVVRMAQAFLAHYASGEKAENFTGDIQSYEYFGEGTAEAEEIPEEMRITLPSKAVAEAWKQE